MANNIYSSRFFCTKCGKETLPIARTASQSREPGHLKNLYCLHCRQEHNCVEIRPFGQRYSYEDFRIEFENGNFDDLGNRIEKYSMFVGRYKK